jgi:hypothetical protein
VTSTSAKEPLPVSVKRRYKLNEHEIAPTSTPAESVVTARYNYDLTDQPTVHFFSTSSGPITSHNWDFDDGTPNSTVKNPSHTYTIIGGMQTFLVRLTVEPGGVFVEKSIEVADPNPSPGPLSATALTIEEATSLTISAATDLAI